MSKNKQLTAAELRSRLIEKSVGDIAEHNADTHEPKGWAPGASWDRSSKTGDITTGAMDEAPEDWGPLLAERGLNPDVYEVNGDTIKMTSWDGWKREGPDEPAVSAIQFSYRATIRLKRSALEENDIDLLELLTNAQKKKKTSKKHASGDTTYVVCLSDWQIGNNDGGGIEAQMDALARLPGKARDQLTSLRKAGTKIDTILIAGLGDLFENCNGFYRHQEFTVELNMRRQAQVIRRALYSIIYELSQLAPKIIVVGVGGNHGENRTDGNRYSTDKADNSDVAVFEQVYDIFDANDTGAFDHIDWRIPDDDLAVSVDVSGYPVAFTHGHIPRPTGGAMNTLWKWWEKQALGRFYPGVASANLLLTGHFHHFNVKEQLHRTIMVAPSLTDVSDYFGDAQGVMSSPGTLTLTVNADGWDNVRILR